jgi:hypothetical protein
LRKKAGMTPYPAGALVQAAKEEGIEEIRECVGELKSAVCHDTCSIKDAICDNAESICRIADDLNDDWSAEKCHSAKASCREATERCCTCLDQDSQGAPDESKPEASIW